MSRRRLERLSDSELKQLLSDLGIEDMGQNRETIINFLVESSPSALGYGCLNPIMAGAIVAFVKQVYNGNNNPCKTCPK